MEYERMKTDDGIAHYSLFEPALLSAILSRERRTRLKAILLRGSVRFGEFKLVSGETSDIYVDAKLTTCSAVAMPLIGKVFIEKMQSRGWFPEAVGGLTVGADPIAFAIAMGSLVSGASQKIDAFIVRKEPKKHGMQRFIEGVEDAHGKKVVIIDDVCSTGGSTAQAVQKAKDAGMEVLGAICLVDRDMGARELLARDFGCTLEWIFQLSELRAEIKAAV
jgi:orotate phosphoribosyltransferase